MCGVLEIHYSDRLELLYGRLRDSLFGTGLGPFARRWVVVPTHAIKSWLQQRLAEDPQVGVAAGIDFLFLEEAVGRLTGTRAPDHLAVRLQVELLLRKGVEPLREYLTSERRLLALAGNLSDLFKQYGLYGGQMLKTWTGWQADLWRAGGWSSLADELEQATVSAWEEGEIHLFGFSHLAPAYHRFFQKLARVVHVHYSVLSPCQAYWGDVRSDRERRYLKRFFRGEGAKEAELDQLDGLLRDCNPLIANLGRLGREYFLMLEESGALTDEVYSKEEAVSSLQMVQADMLWLQPPGPVVDLESDRSVQVHVATSKMREVQVLHNTLLALLDGAEITPGDVIVMAPDIGAYSPFIQTVFGKQLPYQLHDLSRPEGGSLLDGFQRLLDLARGRWRVSKVLALFEHPAFREKSRFTDDDLHQVRRWIRKTGIRWGLDVDHRDAKLAEVYGESGMLERSAATTWRGGINQLLDAVAMDGGDEPLVELAQTELLARMLTLLSSLRDDLKLLQGKKKMLLAEWSGYLECLCDAYFLSEGETGADLVGRLVRLANEVPEERLSFVTVGRLLESIWEERSTALHGHQLDAVRFCSLLPMRAIPSRVVCLLGMDQGAFPRASRREPFDAMSGRSDADPVPSRSEIDRYLFLEALLSARDHLVILYQGVGAGDGQPQGPSVLVDELLSTLDRTCRVGGKMPSEACVQRHPYLSCHSSYYTGEAPNYSEEDYRRAESLYSQTTVEETGVVEAPRFALQDERTVIEVDVGDLRATASDPCRFYLRRTLGLQIEEEWSDGLADEEAFSLSNLDQHRLVWDSLVRPVDQVLDEAVQSGHLPIGPFGEVARERVLSAVAEHRERLQSYGADKLFTLRLEEGAVPPLEVDMGQGVTVRITGEVPFLSSEGIFVPGRAEEAHALRSWPLLCVVSQVLPREVKGQLLFSRAAKVLAMEEVGLDDLRGYLHYHLLCTENLSPLLPRWVPDYLEGKAEALQKRIQTDVSSPNAYLSPYARWAVERGGGEIHAGWDEAYRAAFAVPIDRWFGGKE
jgi:exodeoxyribonuclease V gamma subunit